MMIIDDLVDGFIELVSKYSIVYFVISIEL